MCKLEVCEFVRFLQFLSFICGTRRGAVCVCKLVIALNLSVIKRECVTKLLINPTIRSRARHFVMRTPYT
jgi:hypothetical protein